MRLMITGVLMLLAAGACATDQPQGTAQADTVPAWRQHDDRVDSILPMDEYVRRFNEGLVLPSGLEGGAGSREELARMFFRAVEERDTVSLHSMLVSRAEFASLVFPNHIFRAEPYALDPAVLWLQLQAGSAKGGGRLLERYGGSTIALQQLECVREVTTTGNDLAIWAPCDATIERNGARERGRYFGAIVEHDGRFKFLSAGNDL